MMCLSGPQAFLFLHVLLSLATMTTENSVAFSMNLLLRSLFSKALSHVVCVFAAIQY